MRRYFDSAGAVIGSNTRNHRRVPLHNRDRDAVVDGPDDDGGGDGGDWKTWYM